MLGDPVSDLAHDHGDLNRRVFAVRALVAALDRGERAIGELVEPLGALRDDLFHHFAREEQNLFPFIAEMLPDLRAAVDEMELAHDVICGSLARTFHLVSGAAEVSAITSVFGRFESAYATHAQSETALLDELGRRLTAEQRVLLAPLVSEF